MNQEIILKNCAKWFALMMTAFFIIYYLTL